MFRDIYPLFCLWTSQSVWVSFLPWVEYWYNSSIQRSIGRTMIYCTWELLSFVQDHLPRFDLGDKVHFDREGNAMIRSASERSSRGHVVVDLSKVSISQESIRRSNRSWGKNHCALETVRYLCEGGEKPLRFRQWVCENFTEASLSMLQKCSVWSNPRDHIGSKMYPAFQTWTWLLATLLLEPSLSLEATEHQCTL